jgi:methylenetetrahydrofolate reductase (NADPH)
VPPFADRVANLERKIDAGARFIQTQFCFDLDRLRAFMDEVCRARPAPARGILVGVGTLSSAAPCAGWPSTCPACTCPTP